MIVERIKFYADTPQGQKNKFFCFTLRTIMDIEAAIFRFLRKGFYFRSCWYERINKETGEVIENTRVNMNDMVDNFQKGI